MELKSEFLCEMTITIPSSWQIAQGPYGSRIIAPFSGGTFSGPKLSGKVLPAGADWMIVRPDGVMVIDVRATLEEDDGSVIHVDYGGRIVIPPHLLEKAFNPDTVGDLDPSEYYFRSTPQFEVGTDSPHAWLNGKVAVGVGKLIKGGVQYRIYTIE